MKDGTEAFVLFLRGAQLVLRSSVLTVLDLDGVNVTLENAEIVPLVGSLLSGKVDLLMAAGVAAEVLLVSLSCPLPLLRTHPPSLLVCCFLVLAGIGATNTASGRLEVNLFLSEKRGRKSHFGIIQDSTVLLIWILCIVSRLLLPISIETKQDLRELALLMLY